MYSYFTSKNGFSVGFPFKFYNEFELSGNSFKNFGWFIDKFIFNILVYAAVSILLVRLNKLKK